MQRRDVFQVIVDEVVDLLEKKDKSYGRSYDVLRSEFGPVSFILRLFDKLNRLRGLVKNGNFVSEVGESYEDTIKDIIGYCILELAYVRMEKEHLEKALEFISEEDDGAWEIYEEIYEGMKVIEEIQEREECLC